jgi:hypothetical protein
MLRAAPLLRELAANQVLEPDLENYTRPNARRGANADDFAGTPHFGR